MFHNKNMLMERGQIKFLLSAKKEAQLTNINHLMMEVRFKYNQMSSRNKTKTMIKIWPIMIEVFERKYNLSKKQM